MLEMVAVEVEGRGAVEVVGGRSLIARLLRHSGMPVSSACVM